jgi:hypothetical protein
MYEPPWTLRVSERDRVKAADGADGILPVTAVDCWLCFYLFGCLLVTQSVCHKNQNTQTETATEGVNLNSPDKDGEARVLSRAGGCIDGHEEAVLGVSHGC